MSVQIMTENGWKTIKPQVGTTVPPVYQKPSDAMYCGWRPIGDASGEFSTKCREMDAGYKPVFVNDMLIGYRQAA